MTISASFKGHTLGRYRSICLLGIWPKAFFSFIFMALQLFCKTFRDNPLWIILYKGLLPGLGVSTESFPLLDLNKSHKKHGISVKKVWTLENLFHLFSHLKQKHFCLTIIKEGDDTAPLGKLNYNKFACQKNV